MRSLCPGIFRLKPSDWFMSLLIFSYCDISPNKVSDLPYNPCRSYMLRKRIKGYKYWVEIMKEILNFKIEPRTKSAATYRHRLGNRIRLACKAALETCAQREWVLCWPRLIDNGITQSKERWIIFSKDAGYWMIFPEIRHHSSAARCIPN